MRIKWLVAAALVVGVAATTVANAMPSGPGEGLNGNARVESAGMPPALREIYEQHPVSQDMLDAALARPDRFKPRLQGRGLVPNGPNATYIQEVDNFDTVATLNPQLWVSIDDLNDDGDRYRWGNYVPEVSRCRSTSPTQSLWMFGGGVDGSMLACDDLYPSGANASAIMLLDMSNMFAETPTQLDMTFDYWLNLRTFEEGGVVPDGLFVNLVLPRDDLPVPERVTLARITSEFEERFFDYPWTIDLMAAQDLYDPDREPINVYELEVAFIEFLALTQRPTDDNPNPSTLPGGIFVDQIQLESDVEPLGGGIEISPTPPPSPTPSVTPTASITPTPSLTPTPAGTNTPTSTSTPDIKYNYLPLSVKSHDLRSMDEMP